MIQKTIILSGLLLITNLLASAQQINDTSSVSVKKIELSENHSISHRKGITGFLYGFYKDFISPNDLNSCSFYPSCSTFAVEAVKKKGFFSGILKASDRLQRCNGSRHKRDWHVKDLKSDRYFDPVN